MSAPTPDGPPRGDADSGPRSPADPPARPGWTEVVVGVVVFVLVAYVGLPLVGRVGFPPVVDGLVVTAWSGVAGILGFLAARAIRVRDAAAFAVRRTSWRWVGVGVGAGLLAFVLARLVTALYIATVGTPDNVQEIYTDTGSAGPLALVLSLLLLAVLTPLGEELVFRGVVATVLLRHGWAAGVLGSAVVFAAVHGPNFVAVTAAIVGVVNAELLRRSRSIWPGVVAHAVNNLLALGVGVLVAGAS